jgi:hypothetical protein
MTDSINPLLDQKVEYIKEEIREIKVDIKEIATINKATSDRIVEIEKKVALQGSDITFLQKFVGFFSKAGWLFVGGIIASIVTFIVSGGLVG